MKIHSNRVTTSALLDAKIAVAEPNYALSTDPRDAHKENL